MEHNPWKANRFSASQETPCILWNPEVHYRFRKCLPPVPILSQIVQSTPPHPTSWRFILILSPSTHGSFKWSLSFRFPHQNPIHTPHLPYTCYMLIPLDIITWTILSEQYRSLSSSLCSFLHSPVPSSFVGPYILLSTLFSNALILRYSFNVSDHVSHPYKTTGRIIALYT